MFDLYWEHPLLRWEVHVHSTTHSARWLVQTGPSTGRFQGYRHCGGSSKHIYVHFHWKDLREAVFEVISLCNCILYCAVTTWITQLEKEHGHVASATTLTVSLHHVSRHCNLRWTSESTELGLFTTNVVFSQFEDQIIHWISDRSRVRVTPHLFNALMSDLDNRSSSWSSSQIICKRQRQEDLNNLDRSSFKCLKLCRVH